MRAALFIPRGMRHGRRYLVMPYAEQCNHRTVAIKAYIPGVRGRPNARMVMYLPITTAEVLADSLMREVRECTIGQAERESDRLLMRLRRGGGA